MKKSLQIISMLALASSAMSTNIDNLNLPKNSKAQLLADYAVYKSITDYKGSKRGSGFATAGNAAQCDYHLGATFIQDAIDAGETEIRLVSDTYNETLIINDIDITIKGGYANCSAAQAGTQDTSVAILDAVGTTVPVVNIQGDTQRNTVILENLNLINGNSIVGGSGIFAIGDNQINLKKVRIQDNASDLSGGGIAVYGSEVDFLMEDTVVDRNRSAADGAGIYCSSGAAGSSFFIYGDSAVYLNKADGKGGGIYMSNCDFTITSGSSSGLFLGISSNDAGEEGGGIFAVGGSRINLYGFQFTVEGTTFGDNINPVSLSYNWGNVGSVGDENGGGAYIAGAGTQLVILSALVAENRTYGAGDGGAIAVENGATLYIERLTKPCWSQDHCNHFRSNQSGDTGFGGGIYNSASTALVNSAVFEGNRADFGTAIYGISANSQTKVKGSVFHHNGDAGSNNLADIHVFRVTNGAEIDIEHSTIADNNATISVFGISTSAGGASDLQSSIVHDASSGPVYANSTTPSLISNDCLIVHESSSFTPSTSTILDDPEFVDRGNNDFHISGNSPAIDYCDAFFTDAENYKDIDFEDRGWDDPTVVASDVLWFYDIGADETYAGDIIFKNGFE